MMKQLRCQHGHQFGVASSTDQRVICPLCGSVTTRQAEIHTPVEGALDKTRYQEHQPDDEELAPPLTKVAGKTFDQDAAGTREARFNHPPPKVVPASPADTEVGVIKTVNWDASVHEVSDSALDGQASPADVSSRLSSSKPDTEVLKSSGSIRTTAPMQTEIELTEPPNLPGYKIINELGRGGCMTD